MRENKPRVVLATGSTGAGKTTWLMNELKRAPRLLVWDMKHEFGSAENMHATSDAGALARTLARLGKTGRGRYAFQPPDARAFDWFCRLVWAWAPCACLVEELAAVTNPGKAPPAWHALISRGGAQGLQVYASTQRPTESDTTILGNLTLLHVGRLARANDRALMARELDTDAAALAALAPYQYIERDHLAQKLKTGRTRCP